MDEFSFVQSLLYHLLSDTYAHPEVGQHSHLSSPRHDIYDAQNQKNMIIFQIDIYDAFSDSNIALIVNVDNPYIGFL
ncbi:hypothetical protein J41TS8_01910 [Bacillus sp. J41TS8]|nr:hypothetical protein J41TS8_01910 [Bacillus sp. J41TS8]